MKSLLELYRTFPCRYVLSLLVFTGLVNVYAMRINLSVSILAMTKNEDSVLDGNNVTVSECPIKNLNSTEDTYNTYGELSWTSIQKGTVLGAFFYGYVITNILGGRITELVGAKWIFGLGIFSTSALTMLSPIIARWNFYAFIALRVLIGICEGPSFPAFHCIMGRWIPLPERGFLFTCMQSGSGVGIVIGELLSGVLCQSNFLGGWPSSFYVFGCFGVLWSASWFILMHEHPEDHPRISEKEKNYIMTELSAEGHSLKNISLPWKSILKSVPVWAVVAIMFGNNWVVSFDGMDGPTFLNTVLHYSVKESGILTAAPQFASLFVTLLVGAFGDWIIRKNYFTVTNTRKLFTALGVFTYVPYTVAIVYLRCNGQMFVISGILMNMTTSIAMAGYIVAMIDMAPNFAGTIMGLVNGATQTTSFIVPQVVSAITAGDNSLYKWHIIFYLNMAMFVGGACVFIIFGTAEVQEWSKEKKEPQNNKEIIDNSEIYIKNLKK